MTVDEGIRCLEKARLEVGGDAPLLMADGLPVVRFIPGDIPHFLGEPPWTRVEGPSALYVCDVPEKDEVQVR